MKDLTQLMQQAQAMQQKLQDAQAKMAETRAEGTSGGGLVTVGLKGPGEITSVKIDDSLLVAGEGEILADLIIAAHADAASWYPTEEGRREAAFRNGTLQAGYLILAARALGLDCGPMSGFDMAGVKKEFFDGTTVEPNFIVNLGYGNDENLYPRSPRLDFEEAASII